MKPSRAVYSPGTKCLHFWCVCDSRFGFKTGLPPRQNGIISARCRGCKRIGTYDVRVKEIPTDKGGIKDDK
jgi:hypothetical protein